MNELPDNNYLTYDELVAVIDYIASLDVFTSRTNDPSLVSIESKCYDINGELLGTVKVEDGRYVFFPGEDNAEQD